MYRSRLVLVQQQRYQNRRYNICPLELSRIASMVDDIARNRGGLRIWHFCTPTQFLENQQVFIYDIYKYKWHSF